MSDLRVVPFDLKSQQAVPWRWRVLVCELNGGRIPDGEPGIRDVDAPCEMFQPVGEPFEQNDGTDTGTCETDGHYLCTECQHIELRTIRRRRDQCEDCGTKLVTERGPFRPEEVCSAHCDARLPV